MTERMFTVVSPDGGSEIVRTTADFVRIGSHRHNVISITDPEAGRTHAMIEFDGNVGGVYDLGTGRGTWLGGAKIHGKVPINEGDVIRIGSTKIRYNGVVQSETDAPSDDANAPELAEPAEPQRKRSLADEIVDELIDDLYGVSGVGSSWDAYGEEWCADKRDEWVTMVKQRIAMHETEVERTRARWVLALEQIAPVRNWSRTEDEDAGRLIEAELVLRLEPERRGDYWRVQAHRTGGYNVETRKDDYFQMMVSPDVRQLPLVLRTMREARQRCAATPGLTVIRSES